jgi:DNA-binding transcriptional regulator YiaG
MRKTTLKHFAGLTYLTITNVPVKETEFGEVINLKPTILEKLVAVALIENKVPIRGAEFRVMKSALGLSNEAIAENLGISRNTVLKWGKEVEKRLPAPYEMLFRVLTAELLKIRLNATISDLRAGDKAKKISLEAA